MPSKMIHRLTAAALAYAGPSFVVANINVAWTDHYGSPYYEWGTTLDVSSTGNVAVALGNKIVTYGKTGTVNWSRFPVGSGGIVADMLLDYGSNDTLHWVDAAGRYGRYSSSGTSLASGNTSGVGGGYEDMAADASGNCFLGGGGSDAYLVKMNTQGQQVWWRTLSSDRDDIIRGVETDAAGNIYVAGSGGLRLFDPNASATARGLFVAKYDTDGNRLWASMVPGVGNSSDAAYDLALDPDGNIVVGGLRSVGTNESSLANDGIVHKFSPTGEHLWERVIGSSTWDAVRNIATDAQGRIILAGDTFGGLAGINADTAAGNAFTATDGFAARLDPAGNIEWTYQFGAPGQDRVGDVVAVGNTVIVTGESYGNFTAPLAGIADAYLVALTVPEPASASVLIGFAMLLTRRRPARR